MAALGLSLGSEGPGGAEGFRVNGLSCFLHQGRGGGGGAQKTPHFHLRHKGTQPPAVVPVPGKQLGPDT